MHANHPSCTLQACHPNRLCGYSPAQHNTYSANGELSLTGTDNNPPLRDSNTTPTLAAEAISDLPAAQPGWGGFGALLRFWPTHSAQKPSLLTHPGMSTPAPHTKHWNTYTHWWHRTACCTHPTNTSLHHPKTTWGLWQDLMQELGAAPVLAIQSQAWSISQGCTNTVTNFNFFPCIDTSQCLSFSWGMVHYSKSQLAYTPNHCFSLSLSDTARRAPHLGNIFSSSLYRDLKTRLQLFRHKEDYNSASDYVLG